MRRVRDKLKELDYKLYESLVRSHEIAWNEWLPALSVQQDSYNSFPHIRNLEMYLDTIVAAYEENSKREFFISAVEMYIILAAILFHDIGKINKRDDKPDRHASESSLIICGNSVLVPRDNKTGDRQYKNDKVWASLGIPSYELALSIGKICEYHDIDKVREEAKRKALRNILTSIYVDAYGEVRQKSLAALLTLVDHLDNTHTRIMPEYLRGAGEIKVVGAFRRVITGVYIDLKMHIVRTVLNETLPDGKEAEVKNYKLNHGMETDEEWGHLCSMLELYGPPDNGVFSLDRKDRKISLKSGKQDLSHFFEAFPVKFAEYKANIGTKGEPGTKVSEALEQLSGKVADCLNFVQGNYHYLNEFFNSDAGNKEPPDLLDILIMKDVLRAEIADKKDASEENRVWPQRILQDVILGNVCGNNDALALIKSDLESLGIPISAWLIDHKEHLYNYRGEETFEPVFSISYLYEVASRMWELSTQVFGVSNFTYENLAAMMREPDTQKVKMAVRRISIITSAAAGMNGENGILSGDTSWKWMVDNSEAPCICLDIHEVREIIEGKGEPDGR